jgi:hypothetical protein
MQQIQLTHSLTLTSQAKITGATHGSCTGEVWTDVLILLLHFLLMAATIRLLNVIAAWFPQFAIMLMVFNRILWSDVLYFVMFAFILLLSFEFGYHIWRYSQQGELQVQWGQLSWLMLTEDHYVGGDDKGPPIMSLGGEPWVATLGISFMGIFFVVTVIVLLNLLIAMMNKSYSDIVTETERNAGMFEAKLFQERCTRAYPDPFNIIYVFYPIRKRIKRSCKHLAIDMEYVPMDSKYVRFLVDLFYPLWFVLALCIDISWEDEAGEKGEAVPVAHGSKGRGRSAATAFCDSDNMCKDIDKARREHIKKEERRMDGKGTAAAHHHS